MKRVPIPVTLEKDGEKHEFPSMSDAARFLGCQPGQIHIHSKMPNSSYKGWKITLLGETTKRSDLECRVFMFELDGKYICSFKSVHACSRFLECPANQLVSYLKNTNGKGRDRGIFKNKFILRYTKENDDTYDTNDFK